MKHLSAEAVRALLEAADTDRNRLFLAVIYQHGLRVSEALTLTKRSVHRGYLRVKPRKKGRPSDERMNPDALALWDKVTQNLCPGTLVFPFSRQWGSQIFHHAATRAGLELQLRQGVHSLRHSLAHHMLDAGASLPVVQKALRHRSIGSTGVYLEADGRDVDKWRAKAVTAQAAQPAAPVFLAEIQAEIERLSKLALSLSSDEDATQLARVMTPQLECKAVTLPQI